MEILVGNENQLWAVPIKLRLTHLVIEAANAEFHDLLNLPYKILIKSNGHHYDVTRWVSNVT